MTEERNLLAHWLMEAVAPEEHRRAAATAHVMPIQPASQAAVRDAMDTPAFPIDTWYPAACDLIPQLESESSRHRGLDAERRNRAEARIRARFADIIAAEEARSEEERETPDPAYLRVMARISQVIFAHTRGQQRANSFGKQRLALTLVLRSIPQAALRHPDRLRAFLRDPPRRYLATEILTGLGTAGADLFAEELLDLVAVEGIRSSATGDALQAMLTGDTNRIRQIATWLLDESPDRRCNGAAVLRTIGSEVVVHAPESIPLLMEMLERDSDRVTAIAALGTITTGQDIAVDRLLALSESADSAVKGAALRALGEIGRQPERVVLRLKRALDDFVDENPDNYEHGDHRIVTEALLRFGVWLDEDDT